MFRFLKFKFALLPILVASLFSFFITTSYAQEVEFIHEVKTSYDLDESRNAKVKYEFTTTNKSGNYLQSFSINLPFEPKNLSVANSETKIQLKEYKKVGNNGIYNAIFDLLNPSFGANKSFKWSFEFNVEELVLRHGMQNAIIVPNFQDTPNITRHTIDLNIPKVFGEVMYTYGDAEISQNGSKTQVIYVDSSKSSATFTVLLGNEQEYFIETLNTSQELSVYLPISTFGQEVIWTEAPRKEFALGEENNSFNEYTLKQNENLKGFIQTHSESDKKYKKVTTEVKNGELVKKLLQNIQTNQPKKEIVKNLVSQINLNFKVNEFVTTWSSTVNLSAEKKELNSLEVNRLLREALTGLGIENRGAFGYVFPIQPFARESFATNQHVWTEFWDGSKWVVVDPVWVISSKGSDYIDKNAYHHIKFGEYLQEEELELFLKSAELVKVTPLENPTFLRKEVKINLLGFENTFINKEFRVQIQNTSNSPVKIDKVDLKLNLSKVKLANNTIEVGQILYPNSVLNLSIPLDYGFMLSDVSGNLEFNITSSDSMGVATQNKFDHFIKVRSNISSYFSEILIIVILIFLLITLVSFTLYKKI